MKNRTSLKERKKLAGQLDVSGQLALRHREISIGLAIFGTTKDGSMVFHGGESLQLSFIIMDEDIYKSDELIENPFESNKENRLADKALWLVDDQEDNNKEFTIDQFADFAKKVIILFESLNPKSVPIAYQYIHLLRFQTPFKNENIALYVCNKMDETSSSFADCLIDLLEATHNYILINGNDSKSFILFETIEQCFSLQEDILALIASLSIHSTEISRYFLNLEIIDLITNNFLKYTHNSLINSYRVIYGMIGEYRFLNKSAFLYDD